MIVGAYMGGFWYFNVHVQVSVVWTFAVRSISNIVHLQHHTRPEHSKLHKYTVSQQVSPCRRGFRFSILVMPTPSHVLFLGEVSRSICAPFEKHILSSIPSFSEAQVRTTRILSILIILFTQYTLPVRQLLVVSSAIVGV